MGTGLFELIAQGCQSLAATAAPSITAMGVHIVLALATIMMVWFGVQEALASAHGGPGFSMGRFLNLFMLLTFAYVMVNYYDSSIPGLGFSIKGFIDGGTTSLVNLIGADGSTSMLSEIHAASSKTGPSILNSMMNPYYAIVYFVVQFLLAMLAAIISAILAYGAIAATIIGLLGPIFIPFLVFDKLDWLFWGWLKAYLGFSFYKVVAAATMNVLSHVLTNYYIQLGQSVSDPSMMVQTLPLLVLLVLVNIYILFKIPTPPKELMSCDSTTTCPDIILIDTPIDRHPDLGSSVVDGGTDHHLPSPVGKDYQIVEEGDFNQKEDHGTHLAGIIASQDNHFGLIGIHPGAHLHSWNWNTASGDHAQIANKMLPLQDRPSMQIYVFANSWQWANKKGNPEDRFLSDPIGKRIISSKALWITAAGEQAGAPGKPIYLEQDDGPMNLGEHENVIVVTAYEDSGVPHPYLRRDSNYDSNHSKHGLVHIAGPGGNIPSTMSFGKYASESGTSEATAFVAGVASAMASLYPSYYSNSPAKLKFRLQITSSPDLADEDLPKVRAGMLNAQMALLDPTKNWIDASPIRNLVWCKDSISVLDPSDQRPMEGGKGIDVQDIFRLHERDDGKWFVFEEVKESPGEVIRIGPGLIKDDENLFTADGSLKKLMQVRDVLLAGDVHEVTECR